MYFKIFREAQLMAYMLSYGFNCSVIINHEGERWGVFTNSPMDEWDDIEESIFQQFEKVTHTEMRKPIWWNDNVLREITVLQAATRVWFAEMETAEQIKAYKEEQASENQWERNLNSIEFREDWDNQIKAGYSWEGDHWIDPD